MIKDTSYALAFFISYGKRWENRGEGEDCYVSIRWAVSTFTVMEDFLAAEKVSKVFISHSRYLNI